MSELALHKHITYADTGAGSGPALAFGDKLVTEIIKDHQTPVHVYSLDRIRANYNAIRTAYSTHHNNTTIHYSVKANASLQILKALAAEGCGFDCVSAGEIFKVLHVGADAATIVFAGVGKSREEIDYAVQKGVVWFNVENVEELTHIQASAQLFGAAKINVALRLNPDVDAPTFAEIATGHGGAKFGIAMESVLDVLRNRRGEFPNLAFRGIHAHIGSQLGHCNATLSAVGIIQTLLQEFSFLDTVNIGGGMPVVYGDHADPLPSPEDFARAIAPLLKDHHLMLEPGRSIVGDAGILVTRVLYTKFQGNTHMAIVDASMTDVMRPALYKAKHGIVPVQKAQPSDKKWLVVGPVCESTDVLGWNVSMADEAMRPGALLAILTTGAYGSVLGSNYNARPRAAELLVSEGQVKVARERETFEDLLRREVL